ncbi:3522_t:CDS:2 [Entrophospora sp. SA101]|nr:3522_t:CDS:2 [Entrophospora sp. SA101]
MSFKNENTYRKQQQENFVGERDVLIGAANDSKKNDDHASKSSVVVKPRKIALKACNNCQKIKKKCDGDFLTNSSCSNLVDKILNERIKPMENQLKQVTDAFLNNTTTGSSISDNKECRQHEFEMLIFNLLIDFNTSHSQITILRQLWSKLNKFSDTLLIHLKMLGNNGSNDEEHSKKYIWTILEDIVNIFESIESNNNANYIHALNSNGNNSLDNIIYNLTLLPSASTSPPFTYPPTPSIDQQKFDFLLDFPLENIDGTSNNNTLDAFESSPTTTPTTTTATIAVTDVGDAGTIEKSTKQSKDQNVKKRKSQLSQNSLKIKKRLPNQSQQHIPGPLSSQPQQFTFHSLIPTPPLPPSTSGSSTSFQNQQIQSQQQQQSELGFSFLSGSWSPNFSLQTTPISPQIAITTPSHDQISDLLNSFNNIPASNSSTSSPIIPMPIQATTPNCDNINNDNGDNIDDDSDHLNFETNFYF